MSQQNLSCTPSSPRTAKLSWDNFFVSVTSVSKKKCPQKNVQQGPVEIYYEEKLNISELCKSEDPKTANI